jgi:uncharacterized protein
MVEFRIATEQLLSENVKANMKVLITGGSGLVGSHLIPMLRKAGHEVINLTTKKNSKTDVQGLKNFYWNPEKGEFPLQEIGQIDAVINLAGFSIAKRWSDENKKQMIDSRLQSTALLVENIKKMNLAPKVFVTASATGIYPSSLMWQDESSSHGSGFLADLVRDWEKASVSLAKTSTRWVALRIGVVLDPQGGAAEKLLPFFKKGLGSPVGNGRQMMSWIHIADLCQLILFSFEKDQVKGIYNAVAPNPVTNNEFSKALAKSLKKPYFLPPIPGFFLQLIFGKMISMVISSQRISSKKIENAGFQFQFKEVDVALNNLFQY